MAIQLSDEQVITRFTERQEEMLHAPLNAAVIKQRPGAGGRALKYIKGDTAIDTANKIFGFGQWGYKVVARSHEVIEDDKKGKIEFYTADVELSVAGASFSFPGDGVGIVTAPYTMEMHEKARKEATTDALKRALRHYGDQFGLCLYDEDDYVEAADGTLIPVKDVKVGAKQPPPKRVVDAASAPKQITQPLTLNQRIDSTYKQMIEKGLITPTDDKNANAACFLTICGKAINANITSLGQLTVSRMDQVEKYLAADQIAS